MVKLIKIVKSPKPEKKLRAVFETDSGRTKNVDFGAKGYQDYNQHHDKERRERYRARHAKDLKTGDPTRAGYLANDILWGASTSLQKNISTYKRKYGL